MCLLIPLRLYVYVILFNFFPVRLHLLSMSFFAILPVSIKTDALSPNGRLESFGPEVINTESTHLKGDGQ